MMLMSPPCNHSDGGSLEDDEDRIVKISTPHRNNQRTSSFPLLSFGSGHKFKEFSLEESKEEIDDYERINNKIKEVHLQNSIGVSSKKDRSASATRLPINTEDLSDVSDIDNEVNFLCITTEQVVE